MNESCMNKLWTYSLSMLVSMAGVLPAAAQEGDGPLELEEVVVTAEKREVDLQKTAMSIQVYDGDELKEQGKKRIDEIMSGVVGVQSQDGQVGNAFFMRGVDSGVGGAPGTQFGNTVAVLVDGVYQTRGETVRGGTLDLSQVEVMRGTQSTNLGASALAGAVSLVSNKPVFSYEGSGSLEVGNYNLLNTEGVLNVPLTDNQAVRLAYSTNKRDGYLGNGAGDSDITNARLKYRWLASNDLDMTFTISDQHIGGNGVSNSMLSYFGYWEPYRTGVVYDTVMGYPAFLGHVNSSTTYRDRSNPWDDGYPKDWWPMKPFRDTRVTNYSAQIDWTTDIGTLTVQPSVERSTFRSHATPRGNNTSWMGEDRNQPTEQLEVRLASNQDGALTWLGGLYYYHTDLTGTLKTVGNPGNTTNAPCPVTSTTYCYRWEHVKEQTLTTKSVYAQANYALIPELRFIGGLRYSTDARTLLGSAVGMNSAPGNALGPTTPYVYGAKIDADWSAVTYRAGVEYDLFDNSMAYLTFATGYQPGVLNYNGAQTAGVSSSKNTSDQFTLGLKNRFLDNRLQFNVEAFLLKFKDRPLRGTVNVLNGSGVDCSGTTGLTVQILSTGSCLYPGVAVTMPNEKSQGVDVEVSFLPTGNDRINLTMEYLEATLGARPTAPSFTVAEVLAAAGSTDTATATSLLAQYNNLVGSYEGTTVQNAPKLSGNLSYEHRFNFAGGASLSPRIEAVYKSKYWSQGGGPAPTTGLGALDVRTVLNDGSLYRQDAYSLFNASASWVNADGRFTVTGYVRNIENEAVQTNVNSENNSNFFTVSLDAPRTFGVTMNAKF